MRIERCTVEYLGDAGELYADVAAASVLSTYSTPKRVSVFQRERGKRTVVDTISNASIEVFHDHTIITGESERVKLTSKHLDAHVRLKVTPYGRCVGCN